MFWNLSTWPLWLNDVKRDRINKLINGRLPSHERSKVAGISLIGYRKKLTLKAVMTIIRRHPIENFTLKAARCKTGNNSFCEGGGVAIGKN
jgi:hypothetical protein